MPFFRSKFHFEMLEKYNNGEVLFVIFANVITFVMSVKYHFIIP